MATENLINKKRRARTIAELINKTVIGKVKVHKDGNISVRTFSFEEISRVIALPGVTLKHHHRRGSMGSIDDITISVTLLGPRPLGHRVSK